MREERAGHARERGREGEGDHLEAGGRDSQGLGGDLVLADGLDRFPEARVHQARDDEGRDHDQRQHHVVLAGRRREVDAEDGGPGDGRNAKRAPGQREPVQQDQVNDLAEPERRHREVDPAEAQGGEADQEAGRARHGGGRQEVRDERAAPAHREQRGGVGADSVEAGMPERELAAESGYEVEGERQDDVDPRQHRHVEHVGRPHDRRQEERGGEQAAEGQALPRHAQTLRISGMPRSPDGRTIRTRISRLKATMSR